MRRALAVLAVLVLCSGAVWAGNPHDIPPAYDRTVVLFPVAAVYPAPYQPYCNYQPTNGLWGIALAPDYVPAVDDWKYQPGSQIPGYAAAEQYPGEAPAFLFDGVSTKQVTYAFPTINYLCIVGAVPQEDCTNFAGVVDVKVYLSTRACYRPGDLFAVAVRLVLASGTNAITPEVIFNPDFQNKGPKCSFEPGNNDWTGNPQGPSGMVAVNATWPGYWGGPGDCPMVQLAGLMDRGPNAQRLFVNVNAIALEVTYHVEPPQ